MFTTEANLRLKFQLTSTTDFPTTFLNDAITQAHQELLPRLLTTIDPESPPDTLITGETLLAGARLLQHLAAREAATHRPATIGGQRTELTPRHAALALSAARAEETAWHVLAPHLTPPSPQTITTTDTTPILSAPY